MSAGVDGFKLMGLLEGLSDRVCVRRFVGAVVQLGYRDRIVAPRDGVYALVHAETGAVARIVWWDEGGVENHVPAVAIRRLWDDRGSSPVFRCQIDESGGLADEEDGGDRRP